MRQDEPITAPRAQCERYTDATYTLMRDDETRTSAYERAIGRVAPGRVCLDIGTGALALLALAAARAGADHVIAVEANALAAAAARQAVTDAGMAGRVTVVEGYSTDVSLDRPVDLLLHEVIGSFAGEEGVVTAVRDAKARHLRRGQNHPHTSPVPPGPTPLVSVSSGDYRREIIAGRSPGDCTPSVSGRGGERRVGGDLVRCIIGARVHYAQMRGCRSRSHRSLARSARRASSHPPNSSLRSKRRSSPPQARSPFSSYRSYP